MLKYSESSLSQPPYLELFQSRGPVEVFLGGASLETFSGEAQLKKKLPVQTIFLNSGAPDLGDLTYILRNSVRGDR